jgi:hypothetical protein
MPSATLAFSADAVSVDTTRRLWKRLIILAPLLRLGVVFMTWTYATPQWFFAQASELGVLAEHIRSGHGFSSPWGLTAASATGPTAFLTPGYPAFIAAIFALFHPFSLASAGAITMLQAAFAATTAVALMLLARRGFGERAAIICGVVWAASPVLLWLPTFFWETSLSILLLTSLLALAYKCFDCNTRGWWLVFGGVAALTICVNPSLLTVIASSMGWALWRRRGALRPAVGGLVLFVVLSAIWPVRNAVIMHAFIPLRSNMGYELWQGNRPGADGFFLVAMHPNTSAVELHRWQELGELGYMREKSALAKAAILADPMRFVRLTAKRFVCFWTGVNRTNSWLVMSHICATTVLGLWGAVLLLKHKRSDAALILLPLLLFPLPYYVTHPDFRFRLVLDPILILLAAYALATHFSRRDHTV